jgi:hypothetical protein
MSNSAESSTTKLLAFIHDFITRTARETPEKFSPNELEFIAQIFTTVIGSKLPAATGCMLMFYDFSQTVPTGATFYAFNIDHRQYSLEHLAESAHNNLARILDNYLEYAVADDANKNNN